jgi:nucleoid-associated protein YgaU
LRPAAYCIALLLICSLAGCATAPLRYREQALATLQRVEDAGAETLLPDEYRSTMQALRRGESLLSHRKRDEAEHYFYLTVLKGDLLEREVFDLKERQKQAALKAAQEKKAEEERRAQEEAVRREQARAEALAQKEAAETVRKKPKPQKERPLVISYTVKRGESLPFIASQPEVYGDRTLWPLIYRANRAQIADPRHIWPGQVLRVPRNVSREDLTEARRYAQDRPLH